MSTITPTSDQRQTANVTTFVVGNTVQSTVDGRIGTIVTPQGQLPLPTPQSPVSSRVDVAWADGTTTTVELSTLRRV